MPCHPNDWTKQQFPPPTHFFIAVQIVYRVLGVSLLLPFPSQISKKKKMPRIKMSRERERIFYGRATSTRLVFSLFPLSHRFSKSCGSVCVCVQKKPVPFEPRYIGDDNGFVFTSFFSGNIRFGNSCSRFYCAAKLRIFHFCDVPMIPSPSMHHVFL